MSFSDIIKKSVLEGFNTDISLAYILVTFGLSIIVGAYILFIYKVKTKTQFYSLDFGHSLLILPIITTAIMISIQSNFAVSLGMVGALSIVRFRNAVKSTIDLMYLFLAISLGIVIGAGLFEVALIMLLIVSALLFVVDIIPEKKPPFLLVLSMDTFKDENYMEVVKKNTKSFVVKSRSIRAKRTEIIMEIRCSTPEKLLEELSENKNITSINLLQHNGSVRV